MFRFEADIIYDVSFAPVIVFDTKYKVNTDFLVPSRMIISFSRYFGKFYILVVDLDQLL